MKKKIKPYKGVFIDRFNEKNEPFNEDILKFVKRVDNEFDFERAIVPRGQLDKQLIEQILKADISIACIVE